MVRAPNEINMTDKFKSEIFLLPSPFITFSWNTMRTMRRRPDKRIKISATSSSSAPAPLATPAAKLPMTTPLGTLMRVEAAIWLNISSLPRKTHTSADSSSSAPRVRGSISFDDFYAMVRTQEWLGLDSTVAANGKSHEITSKSPHDALFEVMQKAEKNIGQLVEEERILFDLVAVTGWDPTTSTTPGDSKNNASAMLYSLYQFGSSKTSSSGSAKKNQGSNLNEITRLEVLLPPPTKSGSQIPSRIDVLGNMYHQSRKFNSASTNPEACQKWWEHAVFVSQNIIDHRIRSSPKRTASSDAKNRGKSSLAYLAASIPTSADALITENMTLEERVRIRSSIRDQALLKASKAKKLTSKTEIAGSTRTSFDPHQQKHKALLELADALRSYSLRRGLGKQNVLLLPASNGAGDSALVRLKSGEGRGGLHTANIVRVAVIDLINDARISWNSVMKDAVAGGGGGSNESSRGSTQGIASSGRSGAAPVVTIDLGRVLFQIRMKMVSFTDSSPPSADISQKRQMESYLLELLETLASLVPKWIHLREVPSLLAAVGSPRRRGNDPGNEKTRTAQRKGNIKNSIIVIRNDAVDYGNDVRAKLGGRVRHSQQNGKQGSDNDASKNVAGEVIIGKKRSISNQQQLSLQGQQQRQMVADAIVPPSFRLLYGKALGLDEKKSW